MVNGHADDDHADGGHAVLGDDGDAVLGITSARSTRL